MKKLPFLFALALLLGSAAVYISTVKWTSKEESYSVTIKGGKIEGYFTGLKSEAILDDDGANSSIYASIAANSIKTGNSVRDEHAISEEGLNAGKYPLIEFRSDKVVFNKGTYEATGSLTLKGVTKTIMIPFNFMEAGTNANLTGSFTVKPGEYGVTRGGTPDEVTITLAIPYTK